MKDNSENGHFSHLDNYQREKILGKSGPDSNRSVDTDFTRIDEDKNEIVIEQSALNSSFDTNFSRVDDGLI